jgi:hypothetical protein
MTNNRKKVRWYTCDRCGFQYPETKVVRFNGLVTCYGDNTNNCQDQPGFRAALKRVHVPREVKPKSLPNVTEDL